MAFGAFCSLFDVDCVSPTCKLSRLESCARDENEKWNKKIKSSKRFIPTLPLIGERRRGEKPRSHSEGRNPSSVDHETPTTYHRGWNELWNGLSTGREQRARVESSINFYSCVWWREWDETEYQPTAAQLDAKRGLIIGLRIVTRKHRRSREQLTVLPWNAISLPILSLSLMPFSVADVTYQIVCEFNW